MQNALRTIHVPPAGCQGVEVGHFFGTGGGKFGGPSLRGVSGEYSAPASAGNHGCVIYLLEEASGSISGGFRNAVLAIFQRGFLPRANLPRNPHLCRENSEMSIGASARALFAKNQHSRAMDGLATLRTRRANAGSKLKQLISLEKDVSQTQRLVPDEDDEVALLFAEDEHDEEFRSSSEDELDEEDEDEDNDENDDNDGHKETGDSEDETVTSKAQSTTADDDILSSSDLSGSDTDESEGEKELQQQEQLRKRRQRSNKTVVPAIKKLKPTPKPRAKKRINTSESLMRSLRSSLRALAIESKQALVEKLKNDEKRRAAMAPVVRPQYVELTQEQRLLEAVETERINVKSLNEFMDQELQKKEMQRQLLLLKRKRLRNIIRLVSQESFVTPTEEVEEARYVHDYINGRKKKKPGRKRKEQEEERERLPGDIDTDLPYYRREMWEKRLKLEADLRKKAEKYNSDKGEENGEKENGDNERAEKKDTDGDGKNPEAKNRPGEENSGMSSDIKPDPDIVNETVDSRAAEKDPEQNGQNPVEEVATPTPKLVKFADSEETQLDTKEDTKGEANEDTPEAEVFEGPDQRIARNMVYFLELEEKIDNVKLKTFLFGEQALLPASRRYRDLETIVRIGQAVNPYAVVKDERDELLEPATELTEDDARFDDLRKLPKLGVTEMIYEDDDDEMVEETADIVLNTEAPSGLYLPNGNKKTCLISGDEVRYFDPALGVPYSTVEVYKFLKQMETNTIPWYSIERAHNDFGAAQLYLGTRDGEARHAKGVPEGFEG